MEIAVAPPSRTGTVVRAFIVLALVVLMVALAMGFRRDPRDIKTGTIGDPAPAFDLERLDGPGRVRLADLRGKVVVVNFFASWCVPCKEEAPHLIRAWERYRTSDVAFVGIVYQDEAGAARDFHDRMGQTWPIALDDQGRTAFGFGVFGVPETFFVRPDGIIEGRHIGPIDEETLIRAIEEMRTQSTTGP